MDRISTTLVVALAAGFVVPPATAQEPWVVPPAHANLEGTGSANFIYNSAARTYQITFPGSDFVGAPGLNIVGFTNRLRSTTVTSWPPVDVTFENYDVYLGELANTSGVLSGVFAENVVPGTEVQVRSGLLTIPAGSAVSNGTLPNPFSTHTVEFQTSFTVDTSKEYVMTIRHTGHNSTVASWDRLLSGGQYAGRSASSYTAATGGTLANWIIPQFFVTSGPTACYANCDQSTTSPILNVADFSCFLSKFAAGDSYANCDQSTTQPVLNVADFSCFLSKFAAGCP